MTEAGLGAESVYSLGSEVSYLLKLATMMGMGRVIQSTPQMAQSDPTSFPPAVVGAMSPYPV